MTTMTTAQFAWNQFSLNHIQRESGVDERLDKYLAEKIDDNEEGFDMPGPVTSTTSTKSKKRVQWSPTKHKLAAATAATTATISPVAPAEGFEQVKKAKTRAERRAEEPEVEEPEVEEPVARKDRRSDYWVQRDNLRRDNARTMKNQFQEFEE